MEQMTAPPARIDCVQVKYLKNGIIEGKTYLVKLADETLYGTIVSFDSVSILLNISSKHILVYKQHIIYMHTV